MRPPPIAKHTDTTLPYPTLYLSKRGKHPDDGAGGPREWGDRLRAAEGLRQRERAGRRARRRRAVLRLREYRYRKRRRHGRTTALLPRAESPPEPGTGERALGRVRRRQQPARSGIPGAPRRLLQRHRYRLHPDLLRRRIPQILTAEFQKIGRAHD